MRGLPFAFSAFLVVLCSVPATGQTPPGFHWPNGQQAAVSFSFDDARLTQIDNGLALLRKYGAKATFYVLPSGVKDRLPGWKQAVQDGHEIANHTLTHPCTGNYEFSSKNALEDFTLSKIAAEMDGANAEIQRLLGVKPVTFAYPCGQKWVGRGTGVKSYAPLVAARFLAGRGYLDESSNDPILCDLTQTMGMGLDNLPLKQVLELIADAQENRRWLILVGHEIAVEGEQTTNIAVLEELLKYVKDPSHGIWVDTVQEIAKYVQAQRAGAHR